MFVRERMCLTLCTDKYKLRDVCVRSLSKISNSFSDGNQWLTFSGEKDEHCQIVYESIMHSLQSPLLMISLAS